MIKPPRIPIPTDLIAGDFIVDDNGEKHVFREYYTQHAIRCADCERAIFMMKDGYRWNIENGYAAKIVRKTSKIDRALLSETNTWNGWAVIAVGKKAFKPMIMSPTFHTREQARKWCKGSHNPLYRVVPVTEVSSEKVYLRGLK